MKQLHKKILVGLVFTSLVTANTQVYSFFSMADLRHASSRIVSATRSAMSSLRNFIVPARIATVTHSRLAAQNVPRQFGEKVANFASTAADKIHDACENGKKHAQAVKESVKAKAAQAKDRLSKASVWNRLSLNRFFGNEIELV